MILIKQSWWNIEDLLSPADGKIYRKVTDFYTNEQILYVYLTDNFYALKVKDKSSGKYLPFVEVTDDVLSQFVPENTIIMAVNLGDLTRYNSITERIEGIIYDLYHVRLEIEYLDPCSYFEKRWDLDLQDRFWRFWNSLRHSDIDFNCKDYQISPINLFGRPGYESRLISSGPAQPEFTITVPRGMRLINDFSSTELFLLNPNLKLNIGKPHVTRKDGQESYNIVADKTYDEVKQRLKEENIQSDLSYKVVNKHKFYLIPLFALVLIYMGYKGLNFIFSVNGVSNNNNNSLFTFLFTYLILQISYLTLYLTLRRDNYEIPFNFLVIPSILISTLLLVVCFYYMPNFTV